MWVLLVSGGTSQFNFLELSQSQDLGGEVTNCQDQEDNIPPPDCEKHAKLGNYKCSSHVFIILIMGQVNSDALGGTCLKARFQVSGSVKMLCIFCYHFQGFVDFILCFNI